MGHREEEKKKIERDTEIRAGKIIGKGLGKTEVNEESNPVRVLPVEGVWGGGGEGETRGT